MLITVEIEVTIVCPLKNSLKHQRFKQWGSSQCFLPPRCRLFLAFLLSFIHFQTLLHNGSIPIGGMVIAFVKCVAWW